MSHKTARRNTKQRQIVLDELKKLTSHPTAVELYEIARQRLPRLSLATVYRNLELLSSEGVIQKLEMNGTQSRFDGTPEQHCHVRCVQCGRVDDLHELPPDPLGSELGPTGGYEVTGYRLEFIGICPKCKADHAAEEPPPVA